MSLSKTNLNNFYTLKSQYCRFIDSESKDSVSLGLEICYAIITSKSI